MPGPFYGAETDNCWTGRTGAPSHVLYNETDLRFYVYWLQERRSPSSGVALPTL